MKQRLSSGKYLLLAAAGVLIGSFLPWASFLGYTKYGIEGDGAITAILAGIGLVTLVIGWRTWKLQAPLAGLATLIPLVDMTGFAAFGMYITMLSAMAWLGLALLPVLQPKPSTGGSTCV